MLTAFHVSTLVLISVTMALSLAHALELPGKMRLDRDTYLAVQQIYYPGFTYGGFTEIAGILALAALLFLIPFAEARFWWLAASLALLVASHLTYWFVTHPVNGFWLKDLELTGFGSMFFQAFSGSEAADWEKLRNVWEFSHVARACFAMPSFIAAAVALSL